MENERVVFTAPRQVEVLGGEVPEPGPGQILIRNAATVVSPGTERAVLLQLPNALRRFPFAPGYSNAGVVAAVGTGVGDLRVGDAVVADAPHERYSLRRARAVVAAPPGLPPERAAFAYMAVIAIGGVRKARIELGESVLVMGLGLIGQLAVQLARANGARRVVGLDRHPFRLDLAQRCGAEALVLSDDLEATAATLRDRTGGRGFDVVVDATGFPDAAGLAMAAAATGGRVVLLGSTRGLSTVNLYEDVHCRGLVLIGAHNQARPREDSTPGFWTQQRDMECIVGLLADGRLDVDPLITDRVAPSQAPELYRRVADWDPAVVAVVIDWSADCTA